MIGLWQLRLALHNIDHYVFHLPHRLDTFSRDAADTMIRLPSSTTWVLRYIPLLPSEIS